MWHDSSFEDADIGEIPLSVGDYLQYVALDDDGARQGTCMVCCSKIYMGTAKGRFFAAKHLGSAALTSNGMRLR
jgi:hypothetical protein